MRRKEEHDEAYALSLKAIADKYTNADVFCFTYTPNADSRCTTAKLESYGRVIKALAEYFGFGVVDQAENVVTFDNCIAYTCETQGLHYNSYGHQKLEELVVRSVYEYITK